MSDLFDTNLFAAPRSNRTAYDDPDGQSIYGSEYSGDYSQAPIRFYPTSNIFGSSDLFGDGGNSKGIGSGAIGSVGSANNASFDGISPGVAGALGNVASMATGVPGIGVVGRGAAEIAQDGTISNTTLGQAVQGMGRAAGLAGPAAAALGFGFGLATNANPTQNVQNAMNIGLSTLGPIGMGLGILGSLSGVSKGISNSIAEIAHDYAINNPESMINSVTNSIGFQNATPADVEDAEGGRAIAANESAQAASAQSAAVGEGTAGQTGADDGAGVGGW